MDIISNTEMQVDSKRLDQRVRDKRVFQRLTRISFSSGNISSGTGYSPAVHFDSLSLCYSWTQFSLKEALLEFKHSVTAQERKFFSNNLLSWREDAVLKERLKPQLLSHGNRSVIELKLCSGVWSFNTHITLIRWSLWYHCQMKPGLHLCHTAYTDGVGFFPCPLLTVMRCPGLEGKAKLFFPSLNCRSAVGAQSSWAQRLLLKWLPSCRVGLLEESTGMCEFAPICSLLSAGPFASAWKPNRKHGHIDCFAACGVSHTLMQDACLSKACGWLMIK